MIIIMNDDNKFSVDEILDEAKNGAGSEYYDDSDMTDIEPLEEEPEAENDKKKKKKKQKRHFFGRKKDKTPDYDENEDAYYGMPVKALSDLRRLRLRRRDNHREHLRQSLPKMTSACP